MSFHLYAQEISIIPFPSSLEHVKQPSFVLHKDSRLHCDAEQAKGELKYLQQKLQKVTGFSLPIKNSIKNPRKGAVVFELIEAQSSPDHYSLNVDNQVLYIKAATSKGFFYGIQTYLQLLPNQVYATSIQENIAWQIPAVSIQDSPAFQWRGMHLDVARNFRSIEYVKRFIDLMALHKMNIFHWHLTEDQGWRIEIKKYPKLTEIGAWRDSTLIGHMRDKPHQFAKKRVGGFYTQNQIKEVVAYAQERHITIVPEIEMPGHSQAAIAAYPEFGNLAVSPGVRSKWGISKHIYNPKEATIDFLKDILEEVLTLFPGDYVHIGGDEAHKEEWEESIEVQELLKERGLKDMHKMQSWFISEIGKYLHAKGKKMIGWDEILEGGLAENAAVMSWRGAKGAIKAAKSKHNAVMATNKYTYFDKYQSQDKANEPLSIGGYVPLSKVYDFDPIPEQLLEEEKKYILGAQAQLWSEYIVKDSHMDYMAFPRLCALSEVVWNYKNKSEYTEFLNRLKKHLTRLDILGVSYRKPDEFR
ncbi:MAG: beta-N-acetylhexosaminidase [Flavicella sp.]